MNFVQEEDRQLFITRILAHYGLITNIIENYVITMKNMLQFCYLSIADIKRIMIHFNIPYILDKDNEFYKKIMETRIYLTHNQHIKFMEFMTFKAHNITTSPEELRQFLYNTLSLEQLIHIDNLITQYLNHKYKVRYLSPYSMDFIRINGGTRFDTCNMINYINYATIMPHINDFQDYCPIYKYNYPIFSIFKLMNISGSIKMPLYTGVYPSTEQLLHWMWFIMSGDGSETIFDSFIKTCDMKQLIHVGI
jgi:hypothetical protein